MDPFDNPAWYALTGPQAAFGIGEGMARRFRPDVDPIAALPDDPPPEAWESLHPLMSTDGPLLMMRRHVEVPDSWSVRFRIGVPQMVATRQAETAA